MQRLANWLFWTGAIATQAVPILAGLLSGSESALAGWIVGIALIPTAVGGAMLLVWNKG